MAFSDEIRKHQGQRSVYLDFSLANNAGIDWEGSLIRLFGTAYDDLGPIPVKGTVVSFGQFARSVMNAELSLETPSVTVELVDDNNEWRVLAEPPSHLLIYRWVNLMMRVVDEDGAVFDQRIASGQVTDPAFPPGKRVTLNIQLSPGSFMGEMLPRRLISLRDFPRCPPENIGKVVPVIYGVMSNQVRVAEVSPGSPGATDACGGAVLWEHNFEDAALLTDYYTVSGTVAKGAYGVGGSQGVEINGSGYIRREVNLTGRTGCCSFDIAFSGASPWCDLIFSTTGTVALSIAINSTAGEIDASWRETGFTYDGLISSGAGLTADGTFFTIRTEWQLSSAPSATDGYVRVYVNGVLRVDATSIDFDSAATGNISAVSTLCTNSGGELAYIDNLVVRDGGTTTTTTPAACTPTDTGTGPNMTSGAVRALLVDTGITTVISVQDPAPTPGDLTIDTSIEQMSAGAANERIGAGLINVPTFFFVAPIVGGNVGPLSPIMDLDQGYDPDYPAHDAVISWSDITTTPDQWIVWMFTDSSFHPASNPEPGARVRIIDGTPYTNPTWPPGNPHDYQVVFTSVDDGDPWEPFPALPGATTAFSGYRYLLAGHTLHRVAEVYVRRPVSIPAAVEGEDPTSEEMQVLQHEGTDYVQEIIEVNGNRYHTLRFFAAQQSDDCTQQYEVTANVEGVETNADGTGELITNGIEMVEHILLNWVFNDYRSSTGPYAPSGGRWFTDVPYAPGLLNHTSFLSAYETAFLYVVTGYQGAGMLTEQQSGASLVADLMNSFGLDFYFDPLSISAPGVGAWSVKLFYPDAIVRASLLELRPDPTSLTEHLGIVKDSFSFRFATGSQRNVVPYFAGPMYGRLADASTNESGGYTASGEVRDPDSILRYGLIVNDPLYMPWTRDPATAYSVAYRHLRLVAYPPIMVEVITPPAGVLVSLADEVAVTHPDGTGLSGWTRRVCRVYRANLDLHSLNVGFVLRDVDALVP